MAHFPHFFLLKNKSDQLNWSNVNADASSRRDAKRLRAITAATSLWWADVLDGMKRASRGCDSFPDGQVVDSRE